MPSMLVLGRRWNVSSDDVPIPAALIGIFHLAWCACVSVLRGFAFPGKSLECDEAAPYSLYTIAILACFVAAIIIEVLLAWFGCRGSLFEEQKRKQVPKLIVSHIIVSLVAIAVNIWGSYLLYSFPGGCVGTPHEWQPNSGFRALVWTTWVVLILFLLTIIAPIQFVPSGVNSDPRSWRLRCAVLACCCCRWRQMHQVSSGNRRPLERIADLFHNVLHHADFTSSDLAVTLYLAAMQQRLDRRNRISLLLNQSEREASEKMLTASHMAYDIMPTLEPEALMPMYCKPGRAVSHTELSSAAEIAPYAMAAYGALYYVYANRTHPTAWCTLCWNACCRCFKRSGQESPKIMSAITRRLSFDLDSITLDPKKVMTKAAVCAVASIKEHDLKHVASANVFNRRAPYFIALHRSSRTIVVSIRGTLSLDDTMTDLMCHPQDYQDWAEKLSQDLQSEGILVFGRPCEHPSGSGHSDMMCLAANLVVELFKQHQLPRMLAGDVDGVHTRR